MKYLLDANTYIQAKNTYYQLNTVPGFWDWLDLQFGEGQVGSVISVYDELIQQDDDLSTWIKARREQFLLVDDDQTQSIMAIMASHIASKDEYQEPFVSEFLAGADPWLIAKAATMGAIVVTQESKVGPGSKKVKIPNICEQFNVDDCNTFDVLQRHHARLVLSA